MRLKAGTIDSLIRQAVAQKLEETKKIIEDVKKSLLEKAKCQCVDILGVNVSQFNSTIKQQNEYRKIRTMFVFS